ncbi:glucose-1-phosphate adenylyltransferase subunit GlgD [Enterococcus sp. LJL98]
MKTNRMCALIGNIHRYDELLPLTEGRPLATLPFDCKYRLIDFNLSNVANANIKSLFMVFNEGETQSVFDHLGGGKEWNLDGVQNRFFIHIYQDYIRRSDNNRSYYELVIDYLKKSKSRYAVFMGSKFLCNIDLRALQQIHQAREADLTVVYKRAPKEKLHSSDILLKLDDNNIVVEKASVSTVEPEELVNLCIDTYIIKTDLLIDLLRKRQAAGIVGSIESLLRDSIGENTIAYEYTGYLNNIYDVKSYYEANMDMLDVKKFNSLMYSSQKVYTKMKDEVPTYYTESSVVTESQFATGCTIEGQVEKSLISRGTHIYENAEVAHSLVFANNTIHSGAVIRYAILDKNVIVDPGIRIEGTAENPVVVAKGTHVVADRIGGK